MYMYMYIYLYLIYLSRLLVDQPTIRYYLWHECVQIHNIHLLVLPIKPHHCTQSIMCTSFFCFLYMSLQNPNITNIDWLLLSLLILLGHWLSNVHHTTPTNNNVWSTQLLSIPFQDTTMCMNYCFCIITKEVPRCSSPFSHWGLEFSKLFEKHFW